MPVALITGGLPRPRPGARPRAGRPRLVARRRRPTRRRAGRRGRGSSGRSSRVAGDVTDPATAPRSRGAVAALGRLDLLVNNASTLGPSPLPPLADYPLDDVARGSTRSTSLAPLALIQLLAAGARASGGDDRQHQLRRRRRGLRGLGRLRLGQGRARPAHRGPRRRAAGPARLRLRPRRHAHRDAPGGLPGRGHLRPAGAGAVVPGAAARCSTSGRPSGRYRAADCSRRARRGRRSVTARPRRASTARRLPAPRAARSPRPRPGRGAAAGRAAGAASRHARSPTSAFLRAGRSAGRQHLGDAARGGRRPPRRRPAGRPCTSPPGSTTGLAGRAAPAGRRARARCADVAAGERIDLPRRRPLVVEAPHAAPGRGSRLWRARSLSRATSPALPARGTADRSATAMCRGRWPLATTRRCSPASRAAPRCRAPAGRSPPSWSPTWSPRGIARRADHPAHRRLVAGGRRAAGRRALPRAGGDRAPRQR